MTPAKIDQRPLAPSDAGVLPAERREPTPQILTDPEAPGKPWNHALDRL